MVLSGQQLNTWSNQGAQTTAKNTHQSIRNAIPSIAGNTIEIFLQGSYKNDTNIRGDSDVDVVILLTSTYYRDLSELSEREKRLYYNAHKDASYGWPEFRRDVLTALRNYYGARRVTEGNKSIKIAASLNTVNADVVVSCLFRKFHRFESLSNQSFIEGITFWTIPDNRQIISYPKLHSERLVNKNQQTGGWFKPTVRIFKNVRTFLEKNGIIQLDIVPSYSLESLIYNVPNSYFSSNHQKNFSNVLGWLRQYDISGCMCPDGMSSIFGNNDGQWNINSANHFISLLAQL